MELQTIGENNKTLQIADGVFSCNYNEALVHQVVTAYLSAGRAGTKAQKTRSEVRGGGIKPWSQKGSGRARAGTIRSPLWRKGGVVFAAKPRSFAQKVNKKMYRGAIRSILSELIRLDRLHVIESFIAETPKTKDLITKLQNINANISKDVLIIVDSVEKNLYLAARNLPMVNVYDVAAVNPVILVGTENVLITVNALKQFEEILK